MLLFLGSLFALWSLSFWLLFALATILIIALDSTECEGWAFTTMVTFLAMVIGFNPAMREALTTGLVLVCIVSYLACGVFWSFIKWYFFLLNVRDVVTANPPKMTERRRIYGTGRHQEEYEEVPIETTTIRVRGKAVLYPIQIKEFKARIIGWMTYWPWSFVWTMLNDPIRRFFSRVYTACAGTMQRMADSIVPQPIKRTETE